MFNLIGKQENAKIKKTTISHSSGWQTFNNLHIWWLSGVDILKMGSWTLLGGMLSVYSHSWITIWQCLLKLKINFWINTLCKLLLGPKRYTQGWPWWQCLLIEKQKQKQHIISRTLGEGFVAYSYAINTLKSFKKKNCSSCIDMCKSWKCNVSWQRQVVKR